MIGRVNALHKRPNRERRRGHFVTCHDLRPQKGRRRFEWDPRHTFDGNAWALARFTVTRQALCVEELGCWTVGMGPAQELEVRWDVLNVDQSTRDFGVNSLKFPAKSDLFW